MRNLSSQADARCRKFLRILNLVAILIVICAQQVAAQDTVRALEIGQTVLRLAYSSDGRYLVVGGAGGYLRMWDLSTNQSTEVFDRPIGAVFTIDFMPGDDELLFAVKLPTERDSVFKWNLRTRTVVWAFPATLASRNRGGDTIAVSSYDGVVSLVDGATGGLIRRVGQYANAPRGIRLNQRADRIIYYGARNNGSLLIDVADGKPLSSYKVKADVLSARFSPTDSFLAIGTSLPVVLDGTTGDSLLSLAKKVFQAYDIAYSPDGEYLVTVGLDNAILLWDARRGDSLARLGGHRTFAQSMEFSPDGKYVATGGIDGTVRIWPIPQRPSFVRQMASVRNTMNVNAFPDPSLDRTTVEYTLERTASAQLRLVNAMGTDVISMNEPLRQPGTYRVALDVSSLPSGMYFVVVTAGAEQSVRPLRVAR